MEIDAATKIIRSIHPAEFHTFSTATVLTEAYESAVEALADWTEVGGSARFHDPTLRLRGLSLTGRGEKVLPKGKWITMKGFTDDGEWCMSKGLTTHVQSRRGVRGDRDDFTVEFSKFSQIRSSIFPPLYQVIVVKGFNEEVFGKADEHELVGFDFDWSGTDSALLRTPLKDRFGKHYFALVFQRSESLSDTEIESCLWLLSFVGGTVVDLRSVSQLDAQMTEISRDLYRRTHNATRARPPFLLNYPRDGVRYLQKNFALMLEAMCASHKKPTIEIGVAISHALSETLYIDTEIRDLTLALDTLIESDKFKPIESAPITEPRQFKAACRPLLELLRPRLSKDAYERAKTIVSSLNERTHSLRRALFWQTVGFDLTHEQKRAFRHRHPMSHRGFLVGPNDDFDTWQELTHDAAVLRTLVNRCILSLLAWREPAMNYLTHLDEPFPTNQPYDAPE